jgi:DNA-binding transcriptional MerR regulator
MMPEKMNIQAVARLTGLNEHTIRAWEKRYQAITPERADSGRRTYSLVETQRLQLLASLVRRGHSIGTIASLSNEELRNLLQSLQPESPQQSQQKLRAPGGIDPATQAIITSLHRFELDAMVPQLAKAALRLDIRSFVYGVALPLMREVGLQVDSGKLLIAQEHALSIMLRDQLGQMLKLLNSDNQEGRRIALATPGGDIHEFGIILSGILAAENGWSVQYLGPNLPPEELAQACRKLAVEVALLGTTPIPTEELKMPWSDYLRTLDAQLPSTVSLWIGGGAAIGGPIPRLKLRRGTEWIASLETLESLLIRKGGRP